MPQSAMREWNSSLYRLAHWPIWIWLLDTAGSLPRVRLSTRDEGTERRYFYGLVWTATVSQTLLLAPWRVHFC